MDPFARPIPNHPPLIHVKGDIVTVKLYKIERLLDRETTPIRNGQIRVRYLIRWKGYGPEDDQWRTLNELGNADNLVNEYNDNYLSTLSFSPL